MRSRLAVGPALLLAVTAAVGPAASARAAPASCPTALAISGPTGVALSITPAAADPVLGECVSLTNDTRLSVVIRVVRSGATVYGPVALASGATSRDFTPGRAGSETVHATVSAVTVVVYSGVAHLSVSAAGPSASPSPTRSTSPTPTAPTRSTPTRSARPTRHPSAPTSSAATSSATPGSSPTGSTSSRPRATGITLPSFPSLPAARHSGLLLGSNPLVAGQPTSARSSASAVTPTGSTSGAIVAGVIEPAGDDRRGLPIAVAVVLLIGTAAGLGRVVLGYPDAVDSDPGGSHRL